MIKLQDCALDLPYVTFYSSCIYMHLHEYFMNEDSQNICRAVNAKI